MQVRISKENQKHLMKLRKKLKDSRGLGADYSDAKLVNNLLEEGTLERLSPTLISPPELTAAELGKLARKAGIVK